MSLIIRETVVTECTGLAREVETAVRNSTSNPLDDDVIEKICETHVKRIVENANIQIEKQVEERDYQREDRHKLLQSAEMYDSKKSEIAEVVNVRIIRRNDPDNPTCHQNNSVMHEFTRSSDRLKLDPDGAIQITEHSPTANLDDVSEQDLLFHNAGSEFWQEYQTSYDIAVDSPYDQFYDCNYKIVKLLAAHCKTKEEVVKILGTLSAHRDFSGVISISLLHELAQFMLSLDHVPAVPEIESDTEPGIEYEETLSVFVEDDTTKKLKGVKRRRTKMSEGCSFQDDNAQKAEQEEEKEEKKQETEKEETEYYDIIDQYGSYLKTDAFTTVESSSEQAEDTEPEGEAHELF